VPPEKVLSAEEVQRLLEVADELFPRFYPLILFLADTGARLVEVAITPSRNQCLGATRTSR